MLTDDQVYGPGVTLGQEGTIIKRLRGELAAANHEANELQEKLAAAEREIALLNGIIRVRNAAIAESQNIK